MPFREGYPFKLSDTDLDDELETMIANVYKWPDFESLLAEVKLAIIQAGLQEKSRRETAELQRVVNKAVEAADRASKRALLVSVVAVVVAVVTLIAALAG